MFTSQEAPIRSAANSQYWRSFERMFKWKTPLNCSSGPSFVVHPVSGRMTNSSGRCQKDPVYGISLQVKVGKLES